MNVYLVNCDAIEQSPVVTFARTPKEAALKSALNVIPRAHSGGQVTVTRLLDGRRSNCTSLPRRAYWVSVEREVESILPEEK